MTGHDRVRQTAAVGAARIHRSAPAKLNLYLHVTGRRDDGYHELDSLFVFVDVGDRIQVGPAESVTLEVSGPFKDQIPAGPGNLVLKAAQALLDRAAGRLGDRHPRGAAISLTKNLPPASGIGGGSADAAATLQALRELWDLPVADPELMDIGAQIGADVPACLVGRPAQVSSIGDIVEPVSGAPALDFLLVNPLAPVATARVFDMHRETGARFSKIDPIYHAGGGKGARDADELISELARRRNDLEPLARGLAPEVGEVLTLLSALDGCRLARMSGTGATCFAIFESRAGAEAAAAVVGGQRPDWWIAPARTIAEPLGLSIGVGQ